MLKILKFSVIKVISFTPCQIEVVDLACHSLKKLASRLKLHLQSYLKKEIQIFDTRIMNGIDT